MRGCISSCHRPTHFLESRSNGIIRDGNSPYPLHRKVSENKTKGLEGVEAKH